MLRFPKIFAVNNLFPKISFDHGTFLFVDLLGFFLGGGYGKGMIVDKNKTCYYLTEHASNLEVE